MQTHEYTIVTVSVPGTVTQTRVLSAMRELTEAVKHRLSSGWKCEGGLTIDAVVGIVAQPMSRVTTVDMMLLERT